MYLSWIEGSPPKRNAPGSNPGKDAKNDAESFVKSRLSAFLIFITYVDELLTLIKIEHNNNIVKSEYFAKQN